MTAARLWEKCCKSAQLLTPLNVPWLLLETHSTGTASGMLADVTLVRRSDTQAGVPPMACDAEHQNNEVRVPYQATYTFYTTSK